MIARLAVLVVEDEPPALKHMHSLVIDDDQVQQVLVASDAEQARVILSEHQVDVVLMDIHLPGDSGLQLAKELHEDVAGPQIIFVTADAQPAVEAFELQARDYLLKPIRASRLHQALGRVSAEASAAEPHESEPARISVLQGDSTVLVEILSIQWVQAHGDYARLFTADSSYLYRISLGDLEQQWEKYGFLRVHRSHVVNLNYVTRVFHRQGKMTVHVAGRDIAVSRRLMPHLRERLNLQAQQGSTRLSKSGVKTAVAEETSE